MATTTMNEVSCGQVLAGKFKVERVVGAGGMGVVLAARHLQLLERVAIKMPHRHLLGRSGTIDRFLREARVAMRLRGEHVVRVHDIAATEDGVPFLVMELLEGADLALTLRTRGPLPVAEAVGLVLQACEALAEAHGAGVIHRDLKPANLFLAARVDGSPCLKVLDFGAAKIAPDTQYVAIDALALTAPSSIRTRIESWRALLETAEKIDAPESTTAALGSPRYMAPEQVHSPRDVDARADVWALGAILHELVSGSPAFPGDRVDEVRRAILSGEAAPLRVNEKPARELESVLLRCFAKDPAGRYPDVHAFAGAIARFGTRDAGASVARVARIGRPRGPAAAVGARGAERRALLRTAIAVLVGLALGGGLVGAMTSRAREAPAVSAPAR